MRYAPTPASHSSPTSPASPLPYKVPFLALSILFCLSAFAAEARKPNVVFILSDDQGLGDAACYGAKDLLTPAMDSIAARGVRFTQFYSAAPFCTPSRAALMTGRHPLRAGLTGWNALPTNQVTMAEMFKAAGYTTALIGKWHLGATPETIPNARGFDYSFGHMGGCIDNYSHFFYWGGANRHDLHRNGIEIHLPGRFFPDLMVEETNAFIEANKDKPFFVYFASNLPHYPYQGDTKWVEHYKSLPYPRNLYAAFVTTLDERIGQVLKKIDDLGLRNDTIIIYQSDNGHSTETRAHGGGGSAGIYRGAKFSLFEGGIRLPGMIAWPGHLPEGAVREQMVHACDWMPTLAELCGIPLLNEDIDGKSMTPVIAAPDAPTRHSVLHWHVIQTAGNPPQWAVRQGDWKLIGNLYEGDNINKLTADDKKLFLANLAQDPTESRNLAADHPDETARLLKLREEWLVRQQKN